MSNKTIHDHLDFALQLSEAMDDIATRYGLWSAAAGFNRISIEIKTVLSKLWNKNEEACMAETYRDMHDTATTILGYESILEALEATPHASEADNENNLIKRNHLDNTPRVAKGLDDKLYLVFRDSGEAEDFLKSIGHPNPFEVRLYCFGNYENAIEMMPNK